MPVIEICKLWNEDVPARRKKSACAPLSDICRMSRKPSPVAQTRWDPLSQPLKQSPVPRFIVLTEGRGWDGHGHVLVRGLLPVCFPALSVQAQRVPEQGCRSKENAHRLPSAAL